MLVLALLVILLHSFIITSQTTLGPTSTIGASEDSLLPSLDDQLQQFLDEHNLSSSSYIDQDFKDRLYQAALDVATLHRQDRSTYLEQYSSQIPRVPLWDTKVMHAYTLGSGTANRQDSYVTTIKEKPLFEDLLGVGGWRYIRFNHNDVLLAIMNKHLIIWRRELNGTQAFDFRVQSAFAILNHESGKLIDCTFFIKSNSDTEKLYLAVATYREAYSVVHIYIVHHDRITPVFYVKSEEPIARLAYLEGEGIFLTFRSTVIPQDTVISIEDDIERDFKIAKVSVNYPIDAVTFIAHGRSFVAVSNDSVCDVFLYQDGSNFVTFDRLGLRNIVDLETFRIGADVYLLVVGSFEQLLFNVEENELTLQQRFSIADVSQMSVFYASFCRDDVALLAITEQRTYSLFNWFNRKKNFEPVPQEVLPESFRPAPRSLITFSKNQTMFVVLVDQETRKTRVFSINTVTRPIPNPTLVRGNIVSDVMEDLESRIKKYEKDVRYYLHVLSQSVKAYQRISTNHVLTSLVLEVPDAHIDAGHLSPNGGRVIWQGSRLTKADLALGVYELGKRLKDIDSELANLERETQDLVLRDAAAAITGHKTIHGAVSATSMKFTTLELPLVGSYDIKRVMTDIFRLNKPHPQLGKIIVKGNLRVQGNLHTEDFNGLNLLHDVLLTSVPQVYAGTVNFETPLKIHGNFEIANGDLGGVNLNQVIPLSGSQQITKRVHFTSTIRVTREFNSPLIDGVNVNQLSENAFRINQDQVLDVYPESRFPSQFSSIFVNGLVNGIDTSYLDRNIVRGNRPYKMNHLILHDAVFDGGLFVAGFYDGLRFPDSLFLPKLLNPASILSSKRFTKATFKDLVTVDGLVDGLKLPEDVVRLTKDEALPFPLAFANGIEIENELTVTGLIDGVDLVELLDKATSVTVDNAEGVNAIFYGTVVVERHFAITRPTDVDLETLRNDLIFPEDRFIEITGKKSCTSVTASSVLLSGTVNGYNIKDDFVHLKGDQIVRGVKIFKGPVHFDHDIDTGKNIVDGVNIVELYHNRVSLGRNSTMPGSLKCFDTVYVENGLTVAGTLDGLAFPLDVVFRDTLQEQSIVGKRFLKGVKAGDVQLNGDLVVSSLLDGIPINDFLHRRVTLSSNQALSGFFGLGHGNRVDNLEAVHINGKSYSDLINDYATLNTPQTIFGDVFAWYGDTNVFGDIKTSNGINGYKLNELKDRVAKLGDFGKFLNGVTFPDGLVVNGNLEALSLNGIDLNKVAQTVLKKSTGGSLTGVNRFISEAFIGGNIDAGLVNGMILDDSLFLKTRDQTITGMYVFERVDVSANFNPLQLVNGLDISLLNHSVLKKDGVNTVNGNLHFTQPLKVSGNLDVAGLLNGVDLRALKDEAIRSNALDQELLIGGSKILAGPVTIDGQFWVGQLNTVNLSAAFSDMALINRDGIINGPKTFLKPVTIPGNVYVAGDFEVKGLVSGINMPEWSDQAAFVDHPLIIQGEMVFEENTVFDGTTIVVGKINTVNWPEDLILLNTDQPQMVVGVKTFDFLTVATNVEVVGLINHQYHLPSLHLDTFTVNTDQTIPGHKSVEGFVTFDDNVYGRVNNINLEEETIFLEGPEVVMDGRIIFDGNLLVEGNLQAGRICDVDLPELAATAVYTNTEQVIDGELRFQNITVHDVIVEGRVAGLDIKDFQGDVLSLKLEAEESSHQLIGHNQDIDRAVSYLENVAKRSAKYLDHVHLHQGFNYSGYAVEIGDNRVRLVNSKEEVTTVTTYVLDASGNFVVETVERNLMLLITTVKVGSRVLSLWSDLHGHGVIGDGHSYLANFSGFVHGDLRQLTDDIVLVAVLRKNTCQLLEMMLNHELGQLFEISSNVIDGLSDPVSVHLLKTSTKVYVAIDLSPANNGDVCYVDSASAVVIYIWDLTSKSVQFFQRIEGATKHMAAFEKNGIHYLAKSDVSYGNRSPNTEIKFYRRDDRFYQKFEYSYSVSIPNVAAFEYFEMEDGYQYLGVVNGTHLTLGHLAESHGGFNGHSVIPCRHAYSIKKVLANDGHAYLAIGQGHTLAKNRGHLNLYRLTWTGSRLVKPGNQ